MKNFLLVALVLLSTSCSYYKEKMKQDDPLVLPPNFAEMPDVTNPEKPTENQKSAEVEKLKELLLKSDN